MPHSAGPRSINKKPIKAPGSMSLPNHGAHRFAEFPFRLGGWVTLSTRPTEMVALLSGACYVAVAQALYPGALVIIAPYAISVISGQLCFEIGGL